MPNSRATILPLMLLILISHARAISAAASAPTASPASAPKLKAPPKSKLTPATAPPQLPPIPPSVSPSPASSGLDCTNDLLNLTSCLTYVEQGANLTVPEKGCCPSLASLVDNNPICLCQLLSTSNTFGIKIDDTKALTLPTICHVQTPPVSLCNELGIPVPSPGALSPGGGAGVASVPSGTTGQLAPTNSIAAAPSDGGEGSWKAGVVSVQIALVAIISQLIVILV